MKRLAVLLVLVTAAALAVRPDARGPADSRVLRNEWPTERVESRPAVVLARATATTRPMRQQTRRSVPVQARVPGTETTAVRQMRAVGETSVFARVPAPGQPGGLLVDGDTVYASSAGHMGIRPQPLDDWRVFAFDAATGSVRGDRTVDIPRTRPASIAGLAGMARDARRRVYVLDMNGRVLRITPGTPGTEVYATLPYSAADSLVSSPRSMVFDRSGNLYVTDGALPMIWRIAPGGSPVESWFRDLKLNGQPLATGLSAIQIDPTGKTVYFAVCTSRPPAQAFHGAVYTLPLDDPRPENLVEFHHYTTTPPTTVCPRGMVFGRSGRLYVTLQAANQVQILRPDGTEELRFPSAEQNAARDVPYKGPAGIGFTDRMTVLVANANADAILEAFVADGPAHVAAPHIP